MAGVGVVSSFAPAVGGGVHRGAGGALTWADRTMTGDVFWAI